MKLEKSHYWKALVEIEASNIAFSTAVIVHRKGMRIDSIEIATHQSWLKDTSILFDSGKRIKGWIKEQIKTMKPSLAGESLLPKGLELLSTLPEGIGVTTHTRTGKEECCGFCFTKTLIPRATC